MLAVFGSFLFSLVVGSITLQNFATFSLFNRAKENVMLKNKQNWIKLIYLGTLFSWGEPNNLRRVFCLLTIVAPWLSAPNPLTALSIEIMCLHFFSFLFFGANFGHKGVAKGPQVVALNTEAPGACSSESTRICTRGRTSPPKGIPFSVFGKPSFFIVSHFSALQ